MVESNNVIKFALYLEGWSYETGDKKTLKDKATDIPVTEYLKEMKGQIFCPECSVNLYRSPELAAISRNGVKAFFAHSGKYQPKCSLRVKQSKGKRYDSEEIAKKAIEDDELVVIKGFIKYKPEPPELDGAQEYNREPVEDMDGELATVPISRHNGENFTLPSRITTVKGICTEFNKNLYKYFYLPGSKYAVQLKNLLVDVRTVTDIDSVPRFYYGTIVQSWNSGKKPGNVRFTKFDFAPGNYIDFCLKVSDGLSNSRGINDDSKGKVVIMFGTVTRNGIGLCVENVGWGEFAVLPSKYEYLLR